MAHVTAKVVLEHAGTTFAEQAGFTLRDSPAALYQLLVLSTLLAKPISPDLAVAGARELRRGGMRTPRQMREVTWQVRVDALSRAHYRRFDESSASVLGEQADEVIARYRGDLRRLGDAAGRDGQRTAELLTDLTGIGPAGAAIFLREAQRVWSWLVPFVDDRTRAGARLLGFADSPSAVARLLRRSDDPAALAAAFVRATVDTELVARLAS